MSLLSDPVAAAKVTSCLKEVLHLSKKVDTARKASEESLSEVDAAQRRVRNEGKINNANKNRLKAGYEDAVKDLELEEAHLRKALEQVYQIRKIRNEVKLAARNAGNKETIRRGALMKMLVTSAETIPLWVGSESGQEAPPLCGAVPADPHYAAAPGDMAAALVRGPDGDEDWILTEVVGYNAGSGRYEVDDIDEEQKDRHTLSRRKVIPLPTMRACPETNPEALYEAGTTVMAIYPQTTCFYKGVIKQPPQTASEEYEVLFEDSTYADGYSPPLKVAQRYIIQVTEKKKGK